MLEEFERQKAYRQVFRIAIIPEFEEFLTELGFDQTSTKELRELLFEHRMKSKIEELLDSPFRPKDKLKRKSRFSDGSFSVFYSSWESRTAEAEIKFWFTQYAGQPKGSRVAYYDKFTCEFSGDEIDLRGKIEEWPSLIDVEDYSFCNKIGSEALSLKLDGLVTYSARIDNGTNQPIFCRNAIRNPQIEGLVKLNYDSITGNITLQETAV